MSDQPSDQPWIRIPTLALLVSKTSLEAFSSSRFVSDDQYRFKHIIEKADNSWDKSYVAQVEFFDGLIGVLSKSFRRDPLDAGSDNLTFEAFLYQQNKLIAGVRHTGANYLALLQTAPEDLASLQRRLLAINLTGAVGEEVLPVDTVGRESLMCLGTIAAWSGEYLPEIARPRRMQVALKDASEIRPLPLLDPSTNLVFNVDYHK